MTCQACRSGNHQGCDGECECRREDEEIQSMTGSTADAMLAEMVYSNVLYSGSDVARILTNGAGKKAVVLFIQQVLRANRAVQC